MFVATGMLAVLAQSAQSPGYSTILGTISETVNFVLFLTFPINRRCPLIASRRPENPIG
jgi:hypothetical protein